MHGILRTIFFIFLSQNTNAHVPALLIPLEIPQVASHFLSQSEISRAVYSELTQSQDIFVVQFEVKPGQTTLVQVLTPVCPKLPQYEAFQPTAFIIKGDLPWKQQGESNAKFIERLLKSAVAVAQSNYPMGKRPQFHEEFAKIDYWVGGEWRGNLEPGLYTTLVYSSDANKGVFVLGLNEKEAWTADLYAYVERLLPTIKNGLCNPSGFTGRLLFSKNE
ncbi:MAG: hypothetical protein BroJett040_18920 [Oligoflexia bacterium]|nr:MAG: hypothetical protein BroJett040_18920 [Oligoflexia bacterium]